jgi:hypothetical protein
MTEPALTQVAMPGDKDGLGQYVCAVTLARGEGTTS